MWNLNLLSEEKEKSYYNLLAEKIKKELCASKVKSLSDNDIERILLSKPEELYELEGVFPDKAMAKTIFNYDKIIKGDFAYKIADIIGVNTCVYCNKQYVFTVGKGKQGIIRPEFDHYLPKSKYPLFALSLYNLIPSCHNCNNKKSTMEPPVVGLKEMNPYNNKVKDKFRFTYHIKENGFPSSVRIANKGKLDGKVDKFLDLFNIQEIYNAHTNYELKELYEFATKYSNTYLQDVLNRTMSDLRLSQENAYRILFGTELFEDKDNNRPLSKFKRDILTELKILNS
jgi:5-methylcytosine-specific restriction endonuclease McrA